MEIEVIAIVGHPQGSGPAIREHSFVTGVKKVDVLDQLSAETVTSTFTIESLGDWVSPLLRLGFRVGARVYEVHESGRRVEVGLGWLTSARVILDGSTGGKPQPTVQASFASTHATFDDWATTPHAIAVPDPAGPDDVADFFAPPSSHPVYTDALSYTDYEQDLRLWHDARTRENHNQRAGLRAIEWAALTGTPRSIVSGQIIQTIAEQGADGAPYYAYEDSDAAADVAKSIRVELGPDRTVGQVIAEALNGGELALDSYWLSSGVETGTATIQLRLRAWRDLSSQIVFGYEETGTYGYVTYAESAINGRGPEVLNYQDFTVQGWPAGVHLFGVGTGLTLVGGTGQTEVDGDGSVNFADLDDLLVARGLIDNSERLISALQQAGYYEGELDPRQNLGPDGQLTRVGFPRRMYQSAQTLGGGPSGEPVAPGQEPESLIYSFGSGATVYTGRTPPHSGWALANYPDVPSHLRDGLDGTPEEIPADQYAQLYTQWQDSVIQAHDSWAEQVQTYYEGLADWYRERVKTVLADLAARRDSVESNTDYDTTTIRIVPSRELRYGEDVKLGDKVGVLSFDNPQPLRKAVRTYSGESGSVTRELVLYAGSAEAGEEELNTVSVRDYERTRRAARRSG